MRHIILLCVLSLGTLQQAMAENGADLAERFAVAADREAIVRTLVPGTADYYHYRCLCWQHEGKLEEVDGLLPVWKERFDASSDWQQISLRQALLWFDRDPVVGSRRLIDVLNLAFTGGAEAAHGRPQQLNAPVSLSDDAFSMAGLKTLFGVDANHVAVLTTQGVEHFLPDITDPVQLRTALAKLIHPIAPGLAVRVIEDLKAPGGKFGSIPIHTRLTVAQLDACRTALPDLANDELFVVCYLERLRMLHQPAEGDETVQSRLHYVEDLQRFADTLPESGSALRAWLGRHHLVLELEDGQVDAVRLAALLRAPMPEAPKELYPTGGTKARVEAVNPKYLTAMDLSDREAVGPLICEALEEHLAGAKDTSAFDGLVEATWLHQRFLSAKLLHGIGEPAQWLANAADTTFAADLSERIELRFTRDFPRHLPADAAVALPIAIKNVSRLLVRIYRIDPVSCGRLYGQPPSPGMSLAGSVPTFERHLDVTEPHLVRHRMQLELPECAGPGWWIVELVGGGQQAQALVVKGALRYRSETRVDGEHLIVTDEADRLQQEVSVLMDDQRFTSQADGSVRLPYAPEDRSQQSLTILAGNRAWIGMHTFIKESWHLQAGIVLDPEQLVAGNHATLLLRPRLTLCGQEVPFSHLKAARVRIVLSTHDGATQTHLVEHMGDADAGELAIGFDVPVNTEAVKITLLGSVPNQSLGHDEDLSDGRTIPASPDALSARIDGQYLEHDSAGWAIACLGRNGEPLVGQELTLELTHRLKTEALWVTVVTGNDGRARLGTLPGISRVVCQRPAEVTQITRAAHRPHHVHSTLTWEVMNPNPLPSALNVAADTPIRLPVSWRTQIAGARDWSLLRAHDEIYAEDLSDRATLVDDHGAIVLLVPGLGSGSYVLVTPRGDLDLQVVGGTAQGQFMLSPNAIQRIDTPRPLGMQVSANATGMTVHVINATPSTRVHVLGLRFHPAGLEAFARSMTAHATTTTTWLEPSFIQSTPLDPETQYILDRAQADKHPGVMLERPGLVLNPWHDASFAAIGVEGEGSGLMGSRYDGGRRRATGHFGGACQLESARTQAPSLDFLAAAGVVLVNLAVDGQGDVVLKDETLDDAREVMVFACDAHAAVSTVAARGARPLVTRDLRLKAGFPVDQHLVYQRTSQPLPGNATVVVDSGVLDHYRLCATVEDLMHLFAALAPDCNLEAFAPLAHWPTLNEQERRAFYGHFACHEVNLFLWRKDPAFFAAVVRPHLANKLQKTFLDHWLLQDDLRAWLVPDRFDRLNTLERILLARRLGGTEAASIMANLDADFAELQDDSAELGAQTATALLSQDVASAASQPHAEKEPRKNGSSHQPIREVEVAETITAAGGNDVADKTAEGATQLQFYRDVEQTRALIEQNWFEVPWKEQGPQLIPDNRFWHDYAHWNGAGAFLSTACLLTRHTLSQILVALALSDLPFAGAPPTRDGRNLHVPTPALIFREQALAAGITPGDLIVHQRIYRLDEIMEEPRQASPLTAALQPGVPYLCRSMVVNPTDGDITVRILAQIPTMAVPLLGSPSTVGREVVVGPYASLTIDQPCYFPAPGDVTQFPTHCSSGGVVQAAAIATSRVVRVATGDEMEWYRQTDDARLLQHIAVASPMHLDLHLIADRMNDSAFWNRVVTQLEQRQLFDPEVWKFSVLHRDPVRLAEWLRHDEDLLEMLGHGFWSKSLTIEPLGDGGVIHADFAPLINVRVHHLAASPLLQDEQVAADWQRLMERLCLQPVLDDTAHLELAYGYMLQDRFTQADQHFARIDRTHLGCAMIYDYLGAYLAFADGDLEKAASYARAWKDYPVERWRLRFEEVLAQVEENSGRPPVREAALVLADRQALQAQVVSTIQAHVSDGHAIAITSTNLHQCQVCFQPIDLEPLFSRMPFNVDSGVRMSIVTSVHQQMVDLDKDGSARLDIPIELRDRPLAIEIQGGGQRVQLTSFVDAMDVRLFPGIGQLQVLSRTGVPLKATYVKVYAMQNGMTIFHKDGYTDLRGRFDYASTGKSSTQAITKFALLISSDQAGSTVREVPAP